MANHFADSVPAVRQAAMLKLAEYLQDNFVAEQGEPLDGAARDPIYGNAYDWCTPYTGGGYQVEALYPCGYCSGKYLSKAEEDFTNSRVDDALNQFKADNGYDDVPKGKEEEAYEYIDQWLEEQATWLTVEIWTGHINDPAPDMVMVRLSLKYKDAPYFRGGYEEDVVELNYTELEFLERTPAQITAILQEALDHV